MRRWSAGSGRTAVLLWGVVATAVIASGASARSIGIDTSEMVDGPVTCTGATCHPVATDMVTVQITGPTTLLPDEVADYTISITGATQVGAGVSVVAIVDEILTAIEDGILAENDPASQITQDQQFPQFVETGQLTHFAATATALGKFSYDFTVTAPSEPGATLELRGAMNTFNNDAASTGDRWNSTSLFVPEPGSTTLGVAALAAVGLLRRRRLR